MDARPGPASDASGIDPASGSSSEPSTAAAAELLRRGDARAAADDWVGAVELWRAGGRGGAGDAARARLRGVLERFATERVSEGGVPRRALQPLAICLEGAVLGVLAFIAADRGPTGIDPVLLAVGWVGMAVAAGGALVFAARSGRLDGTPRAAAVPDNASLDDLGVRAADVAARGRGIGVTRPSLDAGEPPATTIGTDREEVSDAASGRSERAP